MAGLKEIKKRIRSIESTYKLTLAMKLIASSRLNRTLSLLMKVRQYEKSLMEALKWALSDLTPEMTEKIKASLPDFLSGDLPQKQHVICVLGANRGLCGSYHLQTVNEALKFVKKKSTQESLKKQRPKKQKEETNSPYYDDNSIKKKEQREPIERDSSSPSSDLEVVFVPLTDKTADFFIKNRPQETEPLAGLGYLKKGATFLDQSQYVWEHIEKWIEKEEIGQVSFVGGEFSRSLRQKIVSFDLFPVWSYTHPFLEKKIELNEEHPQTEKETAKAKNPLVSLLLSQPSSFNAAPIVEPSLEKVMEYSARHLVLVKIYRSFLESEACENATRVVTMETSKRNAEELKNKLTLKYNQTRQANITNELVEIIAGTSALDLD
jgi:ATP synthase F1 gamma subunit